MALNKEIKPAMIIVSYHQILIMLKIKVIDWLILTSYQPV